MLINCFYSIKLKKKKGQFKEDDEAVDEITLGLRSTGRYGEFNENFFFFFLLFASTCKTRAPVREEEEKNSPSFSFFWWWWWLFLIQHWPEGVKVNRK